jgi:hypothetical protein
MLSASSRAFARHSCAEPKDALLAGIAVELQLARASLRHHPPHQRRARCPTTAPIDAMMAQAAVYQIATNAVPSFLQASV